MKNDLARKIQEVQDFESLIDFLRDAFRWPIPDSGLKFQEITFDWTQVLPPDTHARIHRCRQLQLYDLEFDLSALGDRCDANAKARQQKLKELGIDPWGIFFLEFENDVKLDACKMLLRQVLPKFVAGPKKPAALPFWRHDRLLFICVTTDFQNIGFTCFSGQKGRPIVDDYIPLIHFKFL